MGSDWAGRMVRDLEGEFGTCPERNVRITSLVRWFVSNPRYEGLLEDSQTDESRMLTDDLPRVLREQPGDSIEERWNNLMDELGYPEKVEAGVYLQSWDDFEEDGHDPGVSSSRNI